MVQETPLDRFKAVLGGAARALSEEAELELAFTADAPTQSGKLQGRCSSVHDNRIATSARSLKTGRLTPTDFKDCSGQLGIKSNLLRGTA